MKIAVTGADGFLAWHVRCVIRARFGADAICIGRAEFADLELLDARIGAADAVIHLAGVNRSDSVEEVRSLNPWLAAQLVASLRRTNSRSTVVYGNSIHSLGESVFGVAKAKAADILNDWAMSAGAHFVDVLLPNLFGEGGRPHYNSVTATFCHLLARGEEPVLSDDKELPLLHALKAAEALVESCAAPGSGTSELKPVNLAVSDLLARLTVIRDLYTVGSLPDLSDSLTRDLFNTYRGYAPQPGSPLLLEAKSDARGSLFEAVKSRGGETQVFFSTTVPGVTRGDHFHLRKVERFLVLGGEGVIRLRKMFSSESVEYRVSGNAPTVVDMPTMWAHSITNVGATPLTTLFYADEIFNPAAPDTSPEIA